MYRVKAQMTSYSMTMVKRTLRVTVSEMFEVEMCMVITLILRKGQGQMYIRQSTELYSITI